MSKVVAKGMDIPVDKIKPSPYQPRLNFDLEDIRESIERDGILIGLTVREKDGYYELIDGERRLRLSKELGYETVPCDIVDIDDETARRMVYKVNKARKNYTPYEEAVFFRKLVEEEGMKPYEVETQLGADHQWVQACLNIWKFPKEIQDNVLGLTRGSISYRVYMTDIRELEPVINRNLDEAIEILRQVIKERMTADEKKELIRRREKKIDEETVAKATEIIEKIAPELKRPETPEEFLEAAKVFRKEAERRKTPEQRAAEEAEKERIKGEAAEKKRRDAEEKARSSLLTGKNNAQSRIEKAIEEGVGVTEFTARLKEIKAMITEDPKKAFEEAKELKNDINIAIRDEQIRKEAAEKAREEERKKLEEERKRLEAEAEEKLRAERERLEEESKKLDAERERLEAEAEAKLEAEKDKLRSDPEFISEIRRDIISPPVPKAEREKGPPRLIKSIDEPVHTISVGLNRETFRKLSDFMKSSNMMIEEAVIHLILKGLKAD